MSFLKNTSQDPIQMKNENYSIKETCPHDIAELKVIAVAATCETTVLICCDCGQELEEPKTEC